MFGIDFKFVGTAVHGIIAIFLITAGTPPWMIVGLLFASRERVEQKYKIPGSVKTWEKNWLMTKALFSKDVWYQWVAPTVMALLFSLFMGQPLWF